MVSVYARFQITSDFEMTKNNLFCADIVQECVLYTTEVEDGGTGELAIGGGGGNVPGFSGAGGGAGGFGGRRNGNGGRRDDDGRHYKYLVTYLILLYFCLSLIYTWCYLWVLCLIHAGIIPDNQLLAVMVTTCNQAHFILILLRFLLQFYWIR